MSVGYSRRMRRKPSLSASTRAAISSCSSASTPSFSSPGSMPRSMLHVGEHLVQLDVQRLALRVRRDQLGARLDDPARRAHPVERLVRAAVGVDRERPVGLEHDEPGAEGEARAEASGVLDRATGDEETHAPESRAARATRATSRTVAAYVEPRPAGGGVGGRATAAWCCAITIGGSDCAAAGPTGQRSARARAGARRAREPRRARRAGW